MFSTMKRIYFLWLLWPTLYAEGFHQAPTKPNIIIVLADDLGFNDVSFHGSNQIFTPNIDALAYDGVILNKYYVPALCTPSRAALLTGRYPIHTGMQSFVIPSDEPWGLPLEETTIAEIFRDAGYSTNIVGKWHLGLHKKDFTPTRRGFDYHFGYLGPYIDYYDHSLIMLNKPYARGYDMRKNLSINYDNYGTYATDVFNDEAVRVIQSHNQTNPLFLYLSHLAPHTANEDIPMQAPEEEILNQMHISNVNRRTYAAMISKMDQGLGKVVQALSDTNMLDNTIILFYADNGAPSLGQHANMGSNYPFRGQKNSPWEGGVRSAGFIWSKLLHRQRRVSDQLIYSTDWLPTLAAAAGIRLSRELNLDGYNLWTELSRNYRSPRRNILHNIDDSIPYSSYLRGMYKYINGSTISGKYDNWLGDIDFNEADPRTVDYSESVLNSQVGRVLSNFYEKSTDFFRRNRRPLSPLEIQNLRESATVRCENFEYTTESERYKCYPRIAPCLFNIDADPCEYFNLAWKRPDLLAQLDNDVRLLRNGARPSVRKPADPNCDPAFYNYTWTWWQDFENTNSLRYTGIKFA